MIKLDLSSEITNMLLLLMRVVRCKFKMYAVVIGHLTSAKDA